MDSPTCSLCFAKSVRSPPGRQALSNDVHQIIRAELPGEIAVEWSEVMAPAAVVTLRTGS
jgi:hypothetical protein